MSHVLYEMGSQRWMQRGACQQVDPELFFPIASRGPAERQIAAAKAICGPCVVRRNCLSYALEAMPEGIWGGTTREERLAGLGSSVRRARLGAGQRFTPGRADVGYLAESATGADGRGIEHLAPFGPRWLPVAFKSFVAAGRCDCPSGH